MKNYQLPPRGQKDYEEFLARIPDYFQNTDFMNAVSAKITNAGVPQIDYEKIKERSDALVQKWSGSISKSKLRPTILI